MLKNIKLLVNCHNITQIEKDLLSNLSETFTVAAYTNMASNSSEELYRWERSNIMGTDVILNIITPKTITSIRWLLLLQHQYNIKQKPIVNCCLGKNILDKNFGIDKMAFLEFPTIDDKNKNRLNEEIRKTKDVIRNHWLEGMSLDNYKFGSCIENQPYESFFIEDFNKTKSENLVFENLVTILQNSNPISIATEYDWLKVSNAVELAYKSQEE